jgi:hypothetical protein
MTISGSAGGSSFLAAALGGGLAACPGFLFAAACAANAAASASSFLFFSSSSLYLIIFLYSLGLTILIVFIVSSQSLYYPLEYPFSRSALYSIYKVSHNKSILSNLMVLVDLKTTFIYLLDFAFKCPTCG